MLIREVMTESVVAVDVGGTVHDAMDAMLGCDVRHIPVIDGDALRGMVSDRDIRSLASPQQGPGGSDGLMRIDLSMPIVDLMKADVISFRPEDDVEELLEVMIDYKVGAVPVTNDQNALVGIVSYVDLLRKMRDVI
jgi:CBS domain-containing protein